MVTNISKKHTASIHRVENGGNMFLRNVGNRHPDYTTLYPRIFNAMRTQNFLKDYKKTVGFFSEYLSSLKLLKLCSEYFHWCSCLTEVVRPPCWYCWFYRVKINNKIGRSDLTSNMFSDVSCQSLKNAIFFPPKHKFLLPEYMASHLRR
jgi:hypothetical protein